jgi:hypothetical protein
LNLVAFDIAVQQLQALGAEGSERNGSPAALAVHAGHGVAGTVHPVFDSALADPFLDLLYGNLEMVGNLIFVDVIFPDKILYIVQELDIQTGWTAIALIVLGKTPSAYYTLMIIFK